MFFLGLCVCACVDVFCAFAYDLLWWLGACMSVTSLSTCVCVHVCVHGSALWCSLIPVDAVISEGVAVYVSPPRKKNMFRDAATAACHLFYHHWSSGDRMHKAFLTIVMLSINHIYGIVLHQIGCDLIPQYCVYATHTQMHVHLCLYIIWACMD